VPPPDFLKDIILRLPLRENWQGRAIAIFYGETGFGYLEWRRCAGTIGPGADVGILGTLRREALGQPIANPITGEGAQGHGVKGVQVYNALSKLITSIEKHYQSRTPKARASGAKPTPSRPDHVKAFLAVAKEYLRALVNALQLTDKASQSFVFDRTGINIAELEPVILTLEEEAEIHRYLPPPDDSKTPARSTPDSRAAVALARLIASGECPDSPILAASAEAAASRRAARHEAAAKLATAQTSREEGGLASPPRRRLVAAGLAALSATGGSPASLAALGAAGVPVPKASIDDSVRFSPPRFPTGGGGGGGGGGGSGAYTPPRDPIVRALFGARP
ncbi:MAG TPA: hypothetical protein VJB02_05280, partial [Coxiellaceae bacterium]|nr:hypothetical protein [Coxiellaceae bacterium]